VAKQTVPVDERSAILDKAVSAYTRRGWLIQSQSATRAQLYRKRERGCLAKLLLFGLWDLIFKRKADVVLLEVDDYGAVKEQHTRAHI